MQTIAEILRHKGSHVTTATEKATVADVLRLLSEKRIGAVAIEDAWGKLAGIFSERDLVRTLAAEGAAALDLPVVDRMTKHVITCTPGDRCDAMLARMTNNRIRHLPVLEDGHLAGIVSIGDLVQARLTDKELEAETLLDISRMRA